LVLNPENTTNIILFEELKSVKWICIICIKSSNCDQQKGLEKNGRCKSESEEALSEIILHNINLYDDSSEWWIVPDFGSADNFSTWTIDGEYRVTVNLWEILSSVILFQRNIVLAFLGLFSIVLRLFSIVLTLFWFNRQVSQG